jgi:hypothetical protein
MNNEIKSVLVSNKSLFFTTDGFLTLLCCGAAILLTDSVTLAIISITRCNSDIFFIFRFCGWLFLGSFRYFDAWRLYEHNYNI